MNLIPLWAGLAFLFACVIFSLGFQTGSSAGKNIGERNTRIEAFENGLMTKEIDHETDKVVYRWVELHKLGYE